MGKHRDVDWTRTGTVAGYAEYLRKQSDALCVVVIRPFNSVLAADAAIAPADCEKRLQEELPSLIEELRKTKEMRAREMKKQRARAGMGARIDHERCEM
jgi:cysteine synthase